MLEAHETKQPRASGSAASGELLAVLSAYGIRVSGIALDGVSIQSMQNLHGTARHSMAWHGTAWYSMAWHGTA
eukprot:363694-Chlamydomonas_euryale.AAC.21